MNIQQKKRLNKLSEENFFLIKYCEDTFFISGSTKNVYTVNWYSNKAEEKNYGSFFCNCPDMKSHAKKYNIYCKHICFIYNKIGKFNRIEFYQNKWLEEEEENILKNKLNKINSGLLDETIQNKELMEKYENNKLMKKDNSFQINKFNKCITDEDCPICFDNFKDTENLYCQSCGNIVHKICIEKWLQTNQSCIFCRSDIWKHYGKENKNTYINLKN